MKLRLCLPLCLATMLLLPLSAPAAPAGTARAANVAIPVVTQFLKAREAGQDQAAYALLSTETQKQIPFAQISNALAEFSKAEAQRQMTPPFRAVVAFLIDIHGALGYKFHLVGPAADDPQVALVQVEGGSAPAGGANAPADKTSATPLAPLVLRIVTSADPGAAGVLRIDGMKSVIAADPQMAERARGAAEQTVSLSNLKQIALGIMMYAQDHDNHLPHADKWVDEVMPYIKSEAVFHDPSAPAAEKWSYAFNHALSGARYTDIASPAKTVIVFESTLGTKNANDDGTSLPKPGRYNSGNVYAFVDGHVEWQPDTAKPSLAAKWR